MSKFISKLTKKQEAQMKPYAEKWIKIGLQTGETDWQIFDKYMPICYEKAGIKYPKNIVRVNSPLVGALAASVAEAILRERRGAVGDAVDGAVDGAVRGAVDDAVDDAVRGAVRDAVGGAVRGAVDGAVGDAVGGAVRGAVDDAVRGAVGGAVDGAVDGAVRGAVRDAVGGAVDGAVQTAINIARKANVSLSWHYWLGGQFWVGYWWYYGVAAVNFFFDICKLKLSKDIMARALAYRKVCESVNYIWPNRDFVMVCARPSHIDRDENGRLHSLTRMAIQYPDGWGLYYVHGVRVNEKIILHPEKLTKKDWINEKNTEVRRVIQEVMGERFVKEIGAKEIHKGKLARLYEVKLKDDPERVARYIKVKDSSTPREYYLRVPPTIDNADAAVAWTFGFEIEDYRLEQET
jgi:hypothetical protein